MSQNTEEKLELPWKEQHLMAAFLAMEPTLYLITLARECGCGLITEDVQRFIWVHCFTNTTDEECHVPYLKDFLKKLIKEVESTTGSVLDEFYEQYAYYMASLEEDASGRGNSWIVKCISYLHDGKMQLAIPLRCSLNMLQGDTGCALWPSSLFLSEVILSFPGIFAAKSCFEVGSGVGLLGVCLQQVKASKVILTDGDASTLENLKYNLEMNKISSIDVSLDKPTCRSDVVQCIHLPWESAKESELSQSMPDIVFGADVIYDPSCLPHLVRLLSILLNGRKAPDHQLNENINNNQMTESTIRSDETVDSVEPITEAASMELCQELKFGPVAFIASVIRNVATFNSFLNLCNEANLVVRDMTKTIRPFALLPYMGSYTRSDVHLFVISHMDK